MLGLSGQHEYDSVVKLLGLQDKPPRVQELGVVSLYGLSKSTDRIWAMMEFMKELDPTVYERYTLSFALVEDRLLTVYPQVVTDKGTYDLKTKCWLTADQMAQYSLPIYVNWFYAAELHRRIQSGAAGPDPEKPAEG